MPDKPLARNEGPPGREAPNLEQPRSPGFMEALTTSWSGRSRRARPASGNDAQAQAVNYIDRRERTIAFVVGFIQLAGGVWAYFQLRHKVILPTRKRPRVTVHQAHIDTLDLHHIAIYFLVINFVLGFGILGAALAKRRAIVGVMILFGGFGFLTYVNFLVGVLFLGIGGWLIFRGRKKQTQTAGGPRQRDVAAAAPSKKTPTPAARKPPPPSSRYTPPQPRRTPSKPKDKPEEKRKDGSENTKSSRFPSWGRR